jgi:hypothetical protein
MTLPQKTFLLLIIPVGAVVILTYVLGLGGNADAMWGGVPERFRGAYTISMILSAISYFVFSSYIFFNILSGDIALPFSLNTKIVNIAYLVLLISSSLWIPLVNAMLSNPSDLIWFGIRSVLILVALATLLLLVLIIKLPVENKSTYYILTIVSLSIFLFHTGILDAIIWPYMWKLAN